MKIANVVSVRDRGPLDSARASGVSGSRVARMSDFLRRYPEIDDSEREKLLGFLSDGAQEEIVQATHMQGLETQLARVRRDHKRHFRTGLAGWMPIIAFVGIPLLGVIWRLFG